MTRPRPLSVAALAAALALFVLVGCMPPALPQVLSSEKTFTSLSFEADDNPSLGGINYALQWAGTYWRTSVALPHDAVTTGLVASFAVSPGATVSVGGVPQTTGVTANDFSKDLYYTVTAEDGSSMTHRVSVSKEEAPPATGTISVPLRVVSYNVHDFYTNEANRHAQIAQAVKNMAADVLVLTEAEATEGKTGYDLGPFKDALTAIGWSMPYSAFAEVGYEDDIVVVSRYPITGSTEILQPSGAWPREGIQATLKVANPSTNAYVYVTVMGLHLKASYDIDEGTVNVNQRIDQAHALADLLRAKFDLASDYIAVAGDMNTWLPGDRDPISTSTLGYLRLWDDAESANDFHAVNEELLPETSTHQLGSVLDHIIISQRFWTQYSSGGSISVVKSVSGISDMLSLSDHYPVLLELDL